MNIGPLSLPPDVVIFAVSFAVGLAALRFFPLEVRREAESIGYRCVLFGLLVARISFVAHYLPSHQAHLWRMLDIRDLGFDLVPGVVSALLLTAWYVYRRATLRWSLVTFTAAGLVTWSLATLASGALTVPSTVPDVTLLDTNGVPNRLSRQDGKPLVVNLWASWCGPCQDEMPVLEVEQRQHPQIDLVFVNQAESTRQVEAFLLDKNLHVKNVYLDGSLAIAKATQSTAYPTTLFYDSKGRLLERHLGRFSAATFEATLNRLYPSLTHTD